jgi:glycosyltransferase involved in cell wall biosynthesis
VKIGFDLTITKINQAGTSVYANSLATALQNLDAENVYQVFATRQQRDMSERKTLRSQMQTIYRDMVWMHVLLPWQVYRTQVDILHMPANVIPMFSSCPTVVTILDMIILQTPQYFTFWHRNYARIFVPLAAKYASMILTISEQSKRDIVRQLNVSPDKVTITYPAASPKFRPVSEQEIAQIRSQYSLGSFILTVGALEPRKNISRLLQAFALLRRSGFSFQLVQAGPPGWFFDGILAEANRLGLQDSVRFLGRVPLDDLVRLYNAASVFVYPSLYEGFGLPALEAMTCGCPVITSNMSSLPEVVGEAGMMIDPYDVQQLADAIQRVLEDKALAQDMRQQGLERASLFSWQRCARETLNVYHQVLGL